MKDTFLRLSIALTGAPDLDPGLSEAYSARLKVSHEAELNALLVRFGQLSASGAADPEIVRRLVQDDTLRPVMAQVALIWFTSALQASPGPPAVFSYGTPDEYFGAIGWRVVGAHPPGLSGGYFGHWRYPPENAPAGDAP
jgi:hypothetical protein